MNFKIYILGIFLVAETFGFSQRNMSASEAVFVALSNNFQIVISEKQHEINQKNNKWSEAGLFPTVTLTVAQNNTIQDNTNNPSLGFSVH